VSTSIFLRLLRDEDKAQALAETITALREGRRLESMVYPVTPVSFRQVPGLPFAYWVSERIRRLFTELPAFESDRRTVKQGLATADDFRFVRAWWEVTSEYILDGANGPNWREDVTTFQAWCRQRTFEGKRWVPFAKGGVYSPYYADLHLVVQWEQDGKAVKEFVVTLPGTSHWSRRVASDSYYFHTGLTYPRRLHRMAVSPLPSGSIISVRGSGIYGPHDQLTCIAGLFSSTPFDFLVKMMLGRFGHPQFDNGTLCITPIPSHLFEVGDDLAQRALECIALQRAVDCGNEISHVFHLPPLLQATSDTLSERTVSWQAQLAEAEQELVEHQRQIDDIAFCLYGIDGGDRRAIEESFNEPPSEVANEEPDADSAVEGAEAEPIADARQLVAELLCYGVGCVFGRWDVRFATGERQPPELPNPFAPLPVCSPGMLTGNDGLPLHEPPPDYPLRTDHDGILLDDPDHPDDIVCRVREVLEVLWHDRADAIEREACEILGVRELRDYFRRPGKAGFWDDHVSRYSKSRRKAPIYWLLQSSKKNYALWIYYHRFDKDMLFKALLNYVEPKIRLEESRLEPLRAQRTASGTSGKGVKKLEKEIDHQEEVISELRDFEEKLRRVANLHLDPDLNDGVVLNIAPLWEFVPWKEAKRYWDELRDGKYEWSSIGKQLRQKGIAHGP
jgi:hypothetical protein